MIDAKLEFLRVIGETSMLWWVSSSALVVTLLGAVWIKRTEIGEARPGLRLGLAGLVGTFLVSIVYYGVQTIRTVGAMESDVATMCESVDPSCVGIFAAEFRMATVGIAVGTTTFAIALFAWTLMSIDFLRSRGEPKSHVASRQ